MNFTGSVGSPGCLPSLIQPGISMTEKVASVVLIVLILGCGNENVYLRDSVVSWSSVLRGFPVIDGIKTPPSMTQKMNPATDFLRSKSFVFSPLK